MKKPILLFSAILCALFHAACTSTSDYTSNKRLVGIALEDNPNDARNWELLTGNWYGKQKLKNGSVREWLTTRSNDGTYQIVFVNTESTGNQERTIETGEWGISRNIYFSIFKGWIEENGFRPSYPQDHWTRDAYEILELTANKLRYVNLETGDEFTATKVADDFEL